MWEPITGADADFSLRELSRAEQRLPRRVVTKFFPDRRYRRSFAVYCKLKRDGFFDLAAMDIIALGARLERDGHRLEGSFWAPVLRLARHFGLQEEAAELRERGGYGPRGQNVSEDKR
jgi:hypothetical protein